MRSPSLFSTQDSRNHEDEEEIVPEPEGTRKLENKALYMLRIDAHVKSQRTGTGQRSWVPHVYAPDVCIEMKSEEGTCLHHQKVVATCKYKSWFSQGYHRED